MTGFKLAPRVVLPVEVAGEAIALLGKRGGGKTNTAKVLAEGMYDAGIQIVVLDPIGVWFGLRASAAGRKEGGLPIPVLGGEHGDVPLEPAAGALIADVVVDSGQSLVIDLAAFGTKGAQTKFVSDFADRLYRRKAKDSTLLHLFLEEADEFAPQRPMRDEAIMLNRVETLVRRGRSRGIGLTMISQRSASLNKGVLTQADVLLVMRTLAPQDRAAIEAWVESHADKAEAKEMLTSLPSLKTGEAWVWNPERDVFRRVQVNLARTFDSTATPKAGARATSSTMKEIDLSKLGQQITATAERAKENDPRELRAEIARLRAELARRPVEVEVQEVEIEKIVEKHILTERDRAMLIAYTGRVEKLAEWTKDLTAALGQRELPPVKPVPVFEPTPSSAVPEPPHRSRAELRRHGLDSEPFPLSGNGTGALGTSAQHFLDTLVRHHPMRMTIGQLGVLARRKTRGGSFNTAMKELREGGYVEDGGGLIVPTEVGIAASNVQVGVPMTSGEVIEQWRSVLPVAAREVLDVLVGVYPNVMSVESVAEATGRQPRGGSWNTALAVLVQSGIMEKVPGGLRASDSLYAGEGVAA